MPRPARSFAPDEYFHLIARGNNKKKVFLDPTDYDQYSDFLISAQNKFEFSLFHFVLMPNHVHLLIRPNDADMSVVMHFISLQYAKYYCIKYNFVGHVWQGRFKSLHLSSEAYLRACGEYIEKNPVRAGLVKNISQWRYSSAKLVPGTMVPGTKVPGR